MFSKVDDSLLIQRILLLSSQNAKIYSFINSLYFYVLRIMELYFLFQYPGWSQMEDGSIRVAEVTEDSLGTYACVPYNALGTMGQSPPAPLVLKVLAFVPMAVHTSVRNM